MIETVKLSQDIVDSVNARLAAAAGMTVEQYLHALQGSKKKHWCSCPIEHGTIFHDDKARKTNQHCVDKHHYHCAKCKKLTQVG